MGTSMSGKSQSGSNPLVPPWAEESDSVTISSGDGNGDEHELSNDDVQQQIPGPPPVHQGSNRFKEARQAFGNYAKKGGNRDDLKSSLKKYASQSTGKGKGGAKRLASGITAGSGLFGLLSGDSVTTSNGTLNFSDLSGLSTDQAIDRIAECLTPTSSDSDIVRTALNYALSEAIEDVESFDDVQFEPELVSNIYTCYLTDLIFQQVVIDMGEAWLHAETFIKQLQMETQLRELINVIVDEKLEKATNGSFESINQNQIAQIQISAIEETIDEWENF